MIMSFSDDAMKAYLQMASQLRWRDMKEEPPEIGERALVREHNRETEIGVYLGEQGWFRDNVSPFGEVVVWLPLPPYMPPVDHPATALPDIADGIIELFRKVGNVSDETMIEATTRLDEDLGLDSLDKTELLWEISSRFGVDVDSLGSTVGEVVSMVVSRLETPDIEK